jgi:hypothetical protein
MASEANVKGTPTEQIRYRSKGAKATCTKRC